MTIEIGYTMAEDGDPEHEGYYENVDKTIEALERLRKLAEENLDGGD